MIADDPDLDRNTNDPAPAAGPVATASASPLAAYQKALERYDGILLVEVLRHLGVAEPGVKPRAFPGLVAERLGESRVAQHVVAALATEARLALGLFALTETTEWPLNGLIHALACLGVDPKNTVRGLLEQGLLAIELDDGGAISNLGRLVEDAPLDGRRVRIHPAVPGVARTTLPPADELPAVPGPVRQVRETDGLEPILRLAVVWQRVDDAPLRRTQQGTLFKRDRDRLEDDPVLAGPIADALEPLPDMAALWLALARGVGLVVDEPENDRMVAAGHDYWGENAFHLAQMIATRWLALRSWHEQGGMQHEGSTAALALPYVRPAVLLWLATAPEDQWVALDDLEAHLRGFAADWDRVSFLGAPPAASPPRARAARGKRERKTEEATAEPGVLQSLLLGAAYQLGLVRTAEEVPSGRRLAQLTPLGRYILALGPPPPPRPAFEHFLYVQPNFEVIAYRQGLTPQLIGQFSRFARWSQVGAALELKLTPESVYRGLEGGLTTQEMLDRLSRHSSRPLPAGVSEALRTWSGRRERVTYYASATLVEFTTPRELEQALAAWPENRGPAPVVISDRLLLVEDDASIPFQRFRLAGARDYRREPEACLEVEADGVTLSLDLGRSDLLVDAELARFADELPLEPSRGAPGSPRRRFRVSAASLARALDNGLTPASLAQWYLRRTGSELPPAIRLLARATQSPDTPLPTSRPLVLHTPSAELLDGLIQHPDTRSYLGQRLGPTAVIIPDEAFEPLRRVLQDFGLSLAEPSRDAEPSPGSAPRPDTGRPRRN